MNAHIHQDIQEKKHQLNVWRAQLHALMSDLDIPTIVSHGLTIDNKHNTVIFRIENTEILHKYSQFNVDEFDLYEDTVVHIINELKDKRMFGE